MRDRADPAPNTANRAAYSEHAGVRRARSRRAEKGQDAMAIWVGDIEKLTEHNDTFRTVLRIGAHSELTVMSIPPGEDIGLEVHPNIDQFLRIEEGHARR